ncbi:Spo0E family sporulation regulatory protein-aspartic acid phosphatase [Aquibacillus halophilus]|uniref:Spo0E family sporulation regulatory protein-aspartic acid phosphatase n=2 Tax=Aquibacillus halophilus TaxID=930132 RepID=A0A6A8D913_9BACI|nr:aspartyl-phosphate phosphatase Spo0E family protein [Aquibacillus halophilus]MRH42078.1 Spo0E family sporulation regulatory protein-aspartic acid phosphatase [Aquibacillus halophilus]
MFTNQTKLDRETIILSIVNKRTEMLKLAETNGLCCDDTIRCSQELDSLLNNLSKLYAENLEQDK